jgi:hypothetical protein
MSPAATAASYEATRSHVRLIESPATDRETRLEEVRPAARKPLSMERVVSSLQLLLAARRQARIARDV